MHTALAPAKLLTARLGPLADSGGAAGERAEILFGAGVLALFMVFVFAAGFVVYKVKDARFARAWSPLVPVIGGRVRGDGGGAATSWLSGNHRGRRVRAAMRPGRNRYSGQTGTAYNSFEIALYDVPGARDWTLTLRDGPLGGAGWHFAQTDPALAARLEQAGVVAGLARLGGSALRYRARDGSLTYEEDVTPRWVPTPGRFREELDLLSDLATRNTGLNR